MKKTRGTGYIPSMHKENYWGDINPGTDYQTLLRRARNNHPKEYSKHSHHLYSPIEPVVKETKKPKPVILPKEEDEDIF